MKSTDISLDRQASSASVIRFEIFFQIGLQTLMKLEIFQIGLQTLMKLVGQAKYPLISL
jgi:hypothetical protein